MFQIAHAQHQVALLDPNAYVHYHQKNLSLTVPPGETWYALNLWQTKVNGEMWWHRRLNIFDALMLPEGTQITTSATEQGFAYICKPSLIAAVENPEQVVSNRLARLRQLPLNPAWAGIAAGAPLGTVSGVSFDNDFAGGMISHCANFGTCWVIMIGGNNEYGFAYVTNTLNEISDVNAMRLTGSVLCPFSRSLFNGVWVQNGTPSGSGISTAAAHGGVLYQKLPADW